MTFAPAPLLEAREYLFGQDADLDTNEVGIVGGPSHVSTGTSYHLGADQLKMEKNPYSARTSRDKAGLADSAIANAANALDIDDDLDELRELSTWMVAQCQAGAPDTTDIREIIYSPDGVKVLQWDRERGQQSAPQPHSDLSHRTHTHMSFYRDSARRNKVGLFQRFYRERTQKVITMFFLQVSGTQEVYASNGVNTRLIPPGQWDLTVAPLIAAGVPFFNNYPSLSSLLDAGGPLLPQATDIKEALIDVLEKTRLSVV